MAPNNTLRFAFLCVAAAGIFCPQPVLWSLPSKFLTGASAAAGLAAINSVGNLGGFIAQNVVPWIRDATGSTIRNALSGGVPRSWRPDDLLRASGDLAAPSGGGHSLALKRGKSKGLHEAGNAPAPAGCRPGRGVRHRNNVIGGPGAFVMAAENSNSFGDVIVKS